MLASAWALIAVGAVFTFAVSATMRGINLSTLGIILMIVGPMGLVIALFFWESYAPFSGWRVRGVGVERVAVDIDPRLAEARHRAPARV